MQIANKRGGSDFVLSEIVPIILTLLFFFSLIVFVNNSANSSLFLEELYAKKIGLAVEQGMPGLEISMDISDLYSAWKKNNADLTNFREGVIKCDQDKNEIVVHAGGASNYYYSFVNERKFSCLVNVKSSTEAVIKLTFNNE
jgi:hypothetical protein